MKYSESARLFPAVLIPGAVVVLWSLVQLAHDREFFWYDDFQAFFLPFFDEMVRSWRDGEWPLLSRNSWCSGNLAGEYQLATFSPPWNALLLAVWSFPLSLPMKAAALSIPYLISLATGVFVLARSRGIQPPLATAAALASALNGWIIAWAACDWIAFLAGASWLPWVWWAMHTAQESESVWKRWLRPGVLLAMLVLAGNAFAIVEAAIIGACLAAQAIARDRSLRNAAPLAVCGLLGMGLSAPAWLLLIEALHFSTRAEWSSSLHPGWLVPPLGWIGLVLPSFVTPWRDYFGIAYPHVSLELACGIVPVAACAAALFFGRWKAVRALKWELVLLAIGVLLASLPSIGQFRWSFRWLPFFHLVLAMVAVTALQAGFAKRASVCAVALVGTAWAGAEVFGRNFSTGFAAAMFGLAAAWVLGERYFPRRVAEWLPAGVVAVSLGLNAWQLPADQWMPKYSFTDRLLDPAPLETDRLYLSLHSANEVHRARKRPAGFGSILRPLNTMHYAGLRFLNGYSSFPGRNAQGLFETMGYVPEPKAESLAGREGERLLRFLGVDGIVFSDEYARYAEALGPEWRKVAQAPGELAYHREPRRYQPVKALTFLHDRPDALLAEPALKVIAERRNSVTVEVSPMPPDPALMDEDLGVIVPERQIAAIGFMRQFLPGYSALFNGRAVPVREYRGLIPIVELPAGEGGRLELRYRPAGLTRGLLLTSITALVMGAIASFGRRRPLAVPPAGGTVT